MKYNADMQAQGYVNREEGIEIGIEIGIEQGIGIGREQGIGIGLAEGEIKATYKNARSLLGVLGVEQISKALEIPLREVQHLYNEKYNVNLD